MNIPVKIDFGLPERFSPLFYKVTSICGLVLNVFVLPGLGTLVNGLLDKNNADMFKKAMGNFICFSAGVLLINIAFHWAVLAIGLVLMIWGLVWSIVDSATQIRRAF